MTSSGPLASQCNRHCRIIFFPPPVCHTIKHQSAEKEQGAPNYAQFHAHPAHMLLWNFVLVEPLVCGIHDWLSVLQAM